MDGYNTPERFIEIPWCINRWKKAQVVLDVGYANAEMHYLQGLGNFNIPELHGLDIAPPLNLTYTGPNGNSRPLLTPVQADVRQTPYQSDFFDLIFLISTIEHVGMDNTGYRPGMIDIPAACGDFDAIHELCRITKPGGRLLLTVPFGKYQNHGWFQQYDMDRLMRLATSTDYHIQEAHFFAYKNGWSECYPHELREVGYQTNGAVNAAGIACMELAKNT